MEFVRLLNAKHFDPTRGKFTSLAFRNSTGGGVSVICLACVDERSVPICDHIETFYPERITGRPAMFWRFKDSELPTGWRVEQQTSDTGDVCHYNLHDLTNGQLKAMLGKKSLSDFSTCAPEGLRVAQPSDVLLPVPSQPLDT